LAALIQTPFCKSSESAGNQKHVELDALLKVMQATATAPPPALSDNTPVKLLRATVIHGYVSQPAITNYPAARRAN